MNIIYYSVFFCAFRRCMMKKLIYKLKNRFLRSCGNDINYNVMQKMIRENRGVIVVDVRTRDEYMYNHLQGAVNVPLHEINQKISRYVKSKNDVIIVYCEYGGRSKKACGKLQKMGYVNVYNLDGGIEAI